MMATALTSMSVLVVTALFGMMLWELGALRAVQRNAARRARRQAAVRAQQTEPVPAMPAARRRLDAAR
ncbi:hypothetical protein O1L68_40245 [Streptomyces lydicus]|nr:hypothetical protein [Streptomyces lydicus]